MRELFRSSRALLSPHACRAELGAGVEGNPLWEAESMRFGERRSIAETGQRQGKKVGYAYPAYRS